MSSESFNAFMAKVQADQKLREQLRAASGDAGLSVQALADFATGHGYSFTAADVTGELSEKQLEGVAGGLTSPLTTTMTYDWDKISPVFSVKYVGSDYFIKLA